MIDVRSKIEEVAAPILLNSGAFLVECHIVPGDHRKIVQLFIDTETGITIDQCAEINRQLGEAIEAQDVLTESYILQVSSPGLKKPLKLLQQYKRNLGKNLRVRYADQSGHHEMIAALTGIDGTMLTFQTKKEEVLTIAHSEIIESIVELPW